MWPVIDKHTDRPVALFLTLGDAERWATTETPTLGVYVVGKKVNAFARICELFVRKK